MNWKLFGRFHRFIYKASGGRFMAQLGNLESVLVETIGRKSGKQRTVPIICYPYRDSIAVCASNGGAGSHPAWYLNMQANPQVVVQRGKQRFDAIAEEVPEADREALWQEVTAANPHQRDYLATTERKIPLVWFRPVED